jgi:hypothetical protein
MVGATLPNSPCASSIDEAQALVRRCAEPRPARDSVKAAIRRASQRLEIPFSRTRDIWYGDARRIDAEEMDRLRHGAEKAELAQAVAAIEFLKNRAVAPASHQVITNLHAALLAFQRDTVGAPLPELDSKLIDSLLFLISHGILTRDAGVRPRHAASPQEQTLPARHSPRE